MAQISEHQRWRVLRDLIEKAIEEIEPEGGIIEDAIEICISPDLSEVYATTMPWWEDERLANIIGSDWHIETATNYEDALDIADLYFDLR